MKETNDTNESAERLRIRSTMQALNEHCGKVGTMVDGWEVKQINSMHFSLDQPFHSTESSLTKAALTSVLETYESLRRDVREIAHVGNVDFEIRFPKLDINFETYYTIAVSLLNLIYQMQLMKLNCCRLLKP